MKKALLDQITQQVNKTQGVILVDPKSSTPEYIRDIVEVAKKHNKLDDVIIAPISSLEDYNNIPRDDRAVLFDSADTSSFSANGLELPLFSRLGQVQPSFEFKETSNFNAERVAIVGIGIDYEKYNMRKAQLTILFLKYDPEFIIDRLLLEGMAKHGAKLNDTDFLKTWHDYLSFLKKQKVESEQ